MNKTRVKTFDSVELMRNIRDRISAEIRGLTPEEEIAWLRSWKPADPLLRRLQKKGAQPGDAPDPAPGRG